MRWRKVDMGNAQFSNLSWKESVRQMIKVKRNWRKCSYKNVTLIGTQPPRWSISLACPQATRTPCTASSLTITR